MNEAGYKLKFVKQMNAIPEAYACRVEDKWRPGVLDLFIKPPNHPAMWAEGKVIVGRLFYPTDLQYETGKRLIAASVPVYLIGWRDGVMYISPWAKKADLRECYSDGGRDFAETLIDYLDGAAKYAETDGQG